MLKAGALVFIGLLLLWPVSLVRGLLREREIRQQEAAADIASSWSAEQLLFGPILLAPAVFETSAKRRELHGKELIEKDVTTSHEAWIFMMPDQYKLEADVATQWRYRGIFRSPVYKSKIVAKGTWKAPELGELGYPTASIDWDRATIAYKVSDPRGMSQVVAAVDEETAEASPYLSPRLEGEWTGLRTAKFKKMPETFELSLELKGSKGLRVFPMGRQGEARISSNWQTPSFTGASLPEERRIEASGFEATYHFSEYGRGLPQAWSLNPTQSKLTHTLLKSSVGVEFLESVSGYRMVDRSLKYALLLITVIFGAFFLFEILSKVGLQAMQFIFVGSSLVLFFLLLLALSELLSFGLAYAIAGTATILLISAYSAFILRDKKRGAVVAGLLTTLFSALYLVLNMQDLALLTGSALLFSILATAMFLTRRFDWSSAGSSKGSA